MLAGALCASLAGSPAARADEPARGPGPRIQVQGALGLSRQTSPGNAADADLSGRSHAAAYDLSVGIAFTPRWGVEIHRVSLGRVSTATPSGDVRYNTRLFSAVASFEQALNQRWSVLARAGIARTRSDADLDATDYHSRSSKTPLVAGLGLRYAATPAASVLLNYDHFGKTGRYADGGAITASALSLAIRWHLN